VLNHSSNLPMEDTTALTMPTLDQYAASVVEKYRVAVDRKSPSHRAADEIVPLIQGWAKEYLHGLTLSGAYAKNTAITLCSHADLLVSVNPIPGMEMKSIFWSLFEYLVDHDLRPKTHTVSMRLKHKGLLVDLIPACREHAAHRSLLFNKRTGKQVHTDLAQHVHLVANSGRQQEICALKIWRERCSLDFPSMHLELTVLQCLGSERFGQLADNISAVLHYLSNRFESAVVSDPANPENIVSDDLSAAEKRAIATAARDTLYGEDWEKMIF
jgi:hypothetical protein